MCVAFKRNNGRLILFRSNHVFYERTRGCLFVRQRPLLRDADVYQKRDRQWPSSFALKRKDFLWHAVLQNADVVFLKRGDVPIVFVSRREEKIGEIGFDTENIVLILSWL